jgi:hypothetical protein
MYRKGYQTVWKQGYWYKAFSEITQYMTLSQPNTLLTVTPSWWDFTAEKMVDRPYRKQNPFDGTNEIQSAVTFTPNPGEIGLVEPGQDPRRIFPLKALLMVNGMFVLLDNTWTQLVSHAYVLDQYPGQVGIPFHDEDGYLQNVWAATDDVYSCTWVKPDDPLTFPGITALLAEERGARAANEETDEEETDETFDWNQPFDNLPEEETDEDDGTFDWNQPFYNVAKEDDPFYIHNRLHAEQLQKWYDTLTKYQGWVDKSFPVWQAMENAKVLGWDDRDKIKDALKWGKNYKPASAAHLKFLETVSQWLRSQWWTPRRSLRFSPKTPWFQPVTCL